MCGVTHADDAALAAAHGASLVGMILWPGAPRAVAGERALSIAAAARACGAEPVGVFVDESAEEIARVAAKLGLRIVQLHGDTSRAALEGLPPHLEVVYALPIGGDGAALAPLPPPELHGCVRGGCAVAYEEGV